MVRIISIFLAVVILLVAVVVVAPGFMDWNVLKGEIESGVQKATGYEVDIEGDVDIALIPAPRLMTEKLILRNPAFAGSERGKTLLTLERADIHVELWPLLKKHVIVQSVELIKPDIYMTFAEGGAPNWMTPQLQNRQAGAQEPEGEGLSQSVSLEQVTITQGVLTFLPQGAEEPISIQNVNMEVAADTLKGPFKLKGNLEGFGQEIALNITTGRLTDDAGSLPVNAEITALKAQANLSYAGVVGLQAPFELQGETALVMADATRFIAAGAQNTARLPVSIKGLLTYARERAQIKNMTIDVAGQPLSGGFLYDTKEKTAETSLRSADMFNLDTVLSRLPPPAAKNEEGGFIPDSVVMPADVNATLAMELPAVVYRGEMYKAASISAEKAGPKISFKAGAEEIPGGGTLNLSGKLEFMDVSNSQKGGVVYSEPVLGVRAQGEAKNLPFTLQVFGFENEALAGLWSKGSADLNAEIKPALATLKSANVKLDDMTVSLTGSFREETSAGPALLQAALNIDKLNYDAVQKALAPKAPQNTAEGTKKPFALPEINLPYDIDLDVNIGNLRAMSHDIRGARARAVMSGDALSTMQVMVEDLGGAQGTLNLSVKSLKQLTGIDASLSADTKDANAFAKEMKIDLPEFSKSEKEAQVRASLNGDAQKAALKANVKALGGDLIAQGSLSNLTGDMAFNDMTLQVKHPNLSQFIQLLNPEAQRVKILSKPLDAYAKVQKEAALYKITDLKADIAGIAMEGALDVNTAQSVPALTGTLRFGDVVLSDNAEAAQTQRIRSSTGNTGREEGAVRWSREALDWGWMQSANLDLQVAANSFKHDRIILTKPQAAISLQSGALSVKDMSAGLFGGTMTLNGNVKADKNPRLPVQIDGQAQLRDIDLAQLSTLTKATGLLTARGKGAFDVEIKTFGVSQAALIYDLSGKGALSGANIILEGFDLAKFAQALSISSKPGDTLAGIWDSTASGGSTQFDAMDGEFAISEGVINISKLDMTGPQAHMATTGSVNLPPWNLKTKHDVTLKQQPEGEYIPPFTFKFEGPLDDPARTFGQGPLQDYLSQKLSRKLEKVINDKLGDKLGGPLGGVIGGALGVPPPAQTPQAPVVTPEPANDNVAPAAGSESEPPAAETSADPPAQPAQQAPKPEDALKDVLKGILQ